MPRLIPFRLAAACALALILSLSLTAGAVAKGFGADLRVVGSGGKPLAEKTQATATTSVATNPQANCFGPGSGGSGDSVAIPGNSPLGLLARASKSVPALRPLSITDSFDFGLALCGVGASVAKGSSSWYLKVNHKALAVSGDAARIKPGDEVLYALARTSAPAYKYPNELALEAPERAESGVPFEVRVFSYDEKGKRKPVAGAKIVGGGAVTGADGSAMVTLAAGSSQYDTLRATRSKEIPSAAVPVFVCTGGSCVKK
jgi:hypothetical protein